MRRSFIEVFLSLIGCSHILSPAGTILSAAPRGSQANLSPAKAPNHETMSHGGKNHLNNYFVRIVSMHFIPYQADLITLDFKAELPSLSSLPQEQK